MDGWMDGNTDSSSRLSIQGDVVGVAPESMDVFFDPSQGLDLNGWMDGWINGLVVFYTDRQTDR